MTSEATGTNKRHEDRGTVGSPVQRPVGLLAPERASVGDTVECDVREPRPQTHRLTLETPASADYATKLLADPRSGWRKAIGCHECAWGKVAGCWRCGSR